MSAPFLPRAPPCAGLWGVRAKNPFADFAPAPSLLPPFRRRFPRPHIPAQPPCVSPLRRSCVRSVGAAYGSRFALWDMGNLAGGKPFVTGTSFSEGGSQFRYARPTSMLLVCFAPPRGQLAVAAKRVVRRTPNASWRPLLTPWSARGRAQHHVLLSALVNDGMMHAALTADRGRSPPVAVAMR